MFKNIEEYYKKNSIFNKISIKILKNSFLMFIIIWMIGYYINYFFAIPITIFFIFCVKKMLERELKTKLQFNFNNKYNGKKVGDIINKKDVILMKKYCIKNKIYKVNTLKNIIEHYRMLSFRKIKSSSFLTILSIIISLVIPFLNQTRFSQISLENKIAYLVGIMIIYIFLYFFYKQIFYLTKLLKGEEELYERLEELFSEILNYKEKNIK